MVVDLFKERKLDILACSETKVKGSGLREWEGQRVIVSGVSIIGFAANNESSGVNKQLEIKF